MTEPQDVLAEALDYSMGPERRRRLAADILVKLTRAGYALVRTPETLDVERGTCWFCKGEFVVDALIAGYDTFEEQRLACLACNERMSGNWRPASPTPPEGSLGVATKDGVRWWTAVADTIPPSPTPPEGLRCEKCGRTDVRTVYIEDGGPYSTRWQGNSWTINGCKRESEHLHRHCQMCHYWWDSDLAASPAPDPGAVE